MFQIWQEIPGKILPRHENEAIFCVVPLFKFWITESPKIFKQIFVDLFVITIKDH